MLEKKTFESILILASVELVLLLLFLFSHGMCRYLQ